MSYQVAKLVARIAENLPEMSPDVMQGWIENPKALQKFLTGLCPPIRDVLIIDCEDFPFVPGDLKVENHKEGGQLEWDPAKVRLHFSPNQQNDKSIQGHKLRKELENEPVLNANVLDSLLDHPNLIPEEWKGKFVFFWGTIYRDSDDHLYVRYLFWFGGKWDWSYEGLGHKFDYRSPAACSQVSSK